MTSPLVYLSFQVEFVKCEQNDFQCLVFLGICQKQNYQLNPRLQVRKHNDIERQTFNFLEVTVLLNINTIIL